VQLTGELKIRQADFNLSIMFQSFLLFRQQVLDYAQNLRLKASQSSKRILRRFHTNSPHAAVLIYSVNSISDTPKRRTYCQQVVNKFSIIASTITISLILKTLALFLILFEQKGSKICKKQSF
jgi:hypothetical protein